MALERKETIMIAPAGTYLCTQSESNRIEQAPQIFAEHLQGRESFLAIETYIFTQRYKIYTPLHELRVIAQ
jgi:hypothetical protein